jgi:spermidine synthase
MPPGVALHALFFLSGAAALAYEVLWMRRFGVLLGATAPAVAAALVAFFAGLGLGGWALGRPAPRFARPLRAFAILEIATGLSALGVEPLLSALQPLQARLYDVSSAGPMALVVARMATAVAAELLPAFCMGGTLPLLAQHVAARASSLGVRAGGLYAVNTLGAACGALVVPAVLPPRLGATGALACAVAVNLAIGIGALVLDRSGGRVRDASPSPERSHAAPVGPRRVGPLALAFASGALTLGLEALATRLFALVHENSVYSFATIVATFLAGLGAGAALARAALRRGVAPRTLVVAGWAAAGAWCVLLPALFVRLTGLEYVGGDSLLAHGIQLARLAAATLLVPSALAGLALPALMEERGGAVTAGGPAVGALVASNTAGAILGPAVALFLLAPAFGLWGATGAIGLAALACALAAAPGAGPLARRALAVAAAVAAASWLAVPPASLPRTKLSPSDRLLDLREGAMGTVAVVERDGQRRIKLNNFYVLGGTAAAGDERLQGHVPLLLHPRPERVAYLGLGTGISLSAVSFHPVREVVALELVPEVVAVARDWFAEANLGVLADPRVRVRAEDARSYVAATRERFDVVIGDLVVPWRRGEASLHTRDSFEAARRALAPGGIFCQWLPAYQLSEPELDSIAASFLDVFPRTTLWRGDFSAGEPALALVGHTDPGGLDAGAADARVRALAASHDRSNPYLVHPAGLWLYFVGPLDPAEPRFRSAPRNRDASPWVELASPELHLRIERGAARGFVGRELLARLDVVRSTPLAGSAAASLRPEHVGWRARGAEIGEAGLLSFEGDDAAADRKGLSALSRLPVEIQTAVVGGPIPPP